MFVDELEFLVESGAGGRGCESYRMRADRKRVPDGGDGGRGGDVIFRADRNVIGFDDLKFRKHVRADSGEPGHANQKTGRNSPPVIIDVPCGTLITDADTQLRIRDLKEHGDQVVVAEGGAPGGGNRHGGSVRPGGASVVVRLHLVFKMVSDVTLIGFPNSGKSLLLNRLTRAHAKSEPYPFSTKSPQLGTLETGDYRQIKICEIPGLLEGSHQGKGVGNKFLRHATRTKLIVLVLDPQNDYGLTLARSYGVLIDELKAYDETLLNIPRLVVITKCDREGFKAALKASPFKSKSGEKVFHVSAESGEGLEELKKELVKRIYA